MLTKNCNDTTGNQTRDLPACSALADKQWVIKFMSVCVSILVLYITHSACAKLSFLASPTLLYFSTLSHKRYDFLKKVIKHKMCVLIFSTTFI